MEAFVPVEGRTVVYCIAPGEYRPAQIVKAWGDQPTSAANLIVFLDGSNDERFKSPEDTSYRPGFPPLGVQNGLLGTPVGSTTAWVTSRVAGGEPDEVGRWYPRKP